MNKNLDDYYSILGVHQSSTFEEIREAYYSLCKDLHPDKIPLESGKNLRNLAEEQLKLINEAYETLKDETSRHVYDCSCKKSVQDNVEDTLDVLLSDSILSEGFSSLQDEERKVWQKHINDIENIEIYYADYLKKVKGHTSLYWHPDTLLLRLDRCLRIIYVGVPSSLFTSLIVIGLFIEILQFLRLVTPNVIESARSMIHIFVLVLASLMLCLLFAPPEYDNIESDRRKVLERDNYIFSDELQSFWNMYKNDDFTSYFRLYKLRKPIYKKGYVKAIHNIKNLMYKDILLLTNYRKERIDKFMEINRYQLTPRYISVLSPSERLLLVKAIELKARIDKENEVVENVLKVAGAVGLGMKNK